MTTKRAAVAVLIAALIGLPTVISPGVGFVLAVCAVCYLLWLRKR